MGRVEKGALRALRSLALVAVALLGAGCEKEKGDPTASGAPAEQPVVLAPENVAVVEERTLRFGPEISGTLRARREAAIRAEIGGAVLEVLAETGERVRAGQPLARIDDAALQQSLLAARSGRSAARNALQVAEANARRARTLAEAGALAAQQAEQAEAGLEAARAQAADADARLALAEEQVGKARVRAPFAGVVAQRQVSAGDVVAPGSPLFVVIDPRRLQFEAAIPAARLAEVRPGIPVDFAVTGFGEQGFQGEIERVSPAVDPATGQVRVYVDVNNDDGRLLSGLYAQGRAASRSEVALAVPEGAVDATADPPTVMRVMHGKVQRVPVRLGLRDDAAGVVAIVEGVSRGDVLVRGSARATLKEGAAVRVAPDGPPASGEPEAKVR